MESAPIFCLGNNPLCPLQHLITEAVLVGRTVAVVPLSLYKKLGAGPSWTVPKESGPFREFFLFQKVMWDAQLSVIGIPALYIAAEAQLQRCGVLLCGRSGKLVTLRICKKHRSGM